MSLIAPIVNCSFLLLYFIFSETTSVKLDSPSTWVYLIYYSFLFARRYADGLQNTTRNIARILLLKSGKSDEDGRAIVAIQLFLTPNSSIKIGVLCVTLCIASFIALTLTTGWLIAILAHTLAVFGFPWFLPMCYQYHLKCILKQVAQNKRSNIYEYLQLNDEFPDLEDTLKDAIQNKRNPQDWWGDIKFGQEPEVEENFSDETDSTASQSASSPQSSESTPEDTRGHDSDINEAAQAASVSESWSEQRETPFGEDSEKHEAISAYLQVKDSYSLLDDDSIADGKKYLLRKNWPANMAQAILPILELAKTGDIDACLLASSHYAIKRYNLKPNPESELSWMVKAAETGHPPSMLRASGMFFSRHAPSDIEHGKSWLIRAAESGDKQALLRLANFYNEGKYFEEDVKRAIYCLFKLYKMEGLFHATQIGRLYIYKLNDYRRGLLWLHHAAKRKEANSYILLYRVYKQREMKYYAPEQAFKWLKLHTEKHPDWTYSAISLAEHYRDGVGTPQDRKAAVTQLNRVIEHLSDKKHYPAYIKATDLLSDIETSLF
jgi:TPR repeat protein